MTDPAALALLLERIALALEHIAYRPRAADDDAARIVRCIFASIGGDPFRLAQVVTLAEQSDLRPALAHAVAGRSAHSLAKVLAPHVGQLLDGLRLERIGTGKPATYRLRNCDSAHGRIGNPWRT